MPDVNRMKRIAEWLGVRLAWLRDDEGPKRQGERVEQTPARYDQLSEEAREVALAWSKLTPETAALMRDVIFMLSLGERKFPWLRRSPRQGESYQEWEQRQVQGLIVAVEEGKDP